MSHLKLMPMGWMSRFKLSKTIEISCVLHLLNKESSKQSLERYKNLQNWLKLYPISCASSFESQASTFRRLAGLRLSFNLRENGLFSEFTHYVFAFRVSISWFYLLYGRDGLTLHCSATESPELVAKVVARLYARLLLPLIKQKKKRLIRLRTKR
jgi:hypothetical protein